MLLLLMLIRAQNTSPEPPATSYAKLLKHELLSTDSVHQGEFPPSQTVVQKHQNRPPPEFSKGKWIHRRWTVHPCHPASRIDAEHVRHVL